MSKDGKKVAKLKKRTGPKPRPDLHVQSRKERDAKIYALHLSGKTNDQISQLTGFHRNTIATAIKQGKSDVPTEDAVNSIKAMDDTALATLKKQLDAGNLEVTLWYLDRRRILGEAAPGPGVQINITPEQLKEKRTANIQTGLKQFGYDVNISG
jgi:hypothetical protein